MTKLNDGLYRYFALTEDAYADDDSGQQDQSAGTSPFRFVQIRCSLDPGPDRVWILERTWIAIPRSEVSDVLGDAAATYGDAAATYGDAAATYIATKISDAAFANTDSWWIVRDPGGFGALAGADGKALEGLHRLLLGDPTDKVVASGLPRPDAAVAAGIDAQIPLPIDGPFLLIKTVLEVAGMVVGVLAGFPVLSTACCKSFLHDQLTRGAARGIEAVVRDLASPASSRERAVQGRERSPGRGRQGQAQGHRAVSEASAGPVHALPVPPARPATRERRDIGGPGDIGGR